MHARSPARHVYVLNLELSCERQSVNQQAIERLAKLPFLFVAKVGKWEMNVTAVTSLSVNGLINIEEKDARERFPACVSLKSSSYTRRSIMCSWCGTILSARWCSTYHWGWIHTAPAKCPGRPPLVTKWTPPLFPPQSRSLLVHEPLSLPLDVSSFVAGAKEEIPQGADSQ